MLPLWRRRQNFSLIYQFKFYPEFHVLMKVIVKFSNHMNTYWYEFYIQVRTHWCVDPGLPLPNAYFWWSDLNKLFFPWKIWQKLVGCLFRIFQFLCPLASGPKSGIFEHFGSLIFWPILTCNTAMER